LDFLILEPEIQLIQISSRCNSEYSNNSQCMFIGMCDVNKIYRILLKIPIKKLPEDAEIVDAKLKLILIPNGAKYANIITPYALIEDWNPNTVTWYNQPTFNSGIFGKSVNVRRASQYVFDITSIVQKWHKNEISNNGIVLKNQEIKNKTLVKSLTDIKKSYAPKVEIFYISKCSCGKCQTQFVDKNEEFDTNDSYSFSKIRNTSITKTVMFFVKNIEIYEIRAHVQVSPDGINFIDEPTEILVGFNEIKFIVPCIFAKFTRVAVKNTCCEQRSRVKIWYQAQE